MTFERPSEEVQAKTDTSRIFKINYTINLLPYVTAHLQMKPDKDGFIKETWVNNKYDVMD